MAQDRQPTAVTVFEAGKEGYPVYRIPAIIRAGNGDLLAICEARSGGDASEIDLVMKRSADSGASWSDLQVVQSRQHFLPLYEDNPPAISVGNPCPILDRLNPQHPNRIWLLFTVENDHIFVIHSDDDARSWSPPREITQAVKLSNWGWYATGPGHGIQLQHGEDRGRLVVAADHRLGGKGEDRGPLGAQLIVSDDFGETWHLGAIDDTYEDGLHSNETMVIELADGRLYVNTRDQNGPAPGTRGEAFSRDGGETLTAAEPQEWHAFSPAPEILDPPVVQCSLLQMEYSSNDSTQEVVLFCGPDENGPSGRGRSDLRIRFSMDSAHSWQDGRLLHTGPAAYSDMTRIDDDAQPVGILFEAGAPGTSPYQRIEFQRHSLTELIEPEPSESP